MPRPIFIVAGAVALAALIGGVTAILLLGGDNSGPARPSEAPVEAEAQNVDDGAPLAAEPLEPEAFPEPDENGITTINWDHLLPEGEMERIETLYRVAQSMNEMDHFGGQMPQIGTFNVEQRLIGRTIRMPGFILPLDLQPEGDITEFLLVPYFGACVHTPPPPPNQIVYVTSDTPVVVEELWAPVWVTGTLSGDAHDNDLGDAAYTLSLISHEPYEF
ncbi:DUF3299 domain-containing protein [Hyphobacterium sp. SN044]|uniref:DUF3299 domain-containing protein n=1 Tax=Hyphobacterium sp. SN044 TaxID=2912575 RepID=UPI001F204E72|nr:DUF3299 domain-containing protein [Hyphobacterium sp. SN044]MCF8880258.1 DUF3299 domain-containing protein [Hyphobacterium sp. SN044]